MRKIGKNVYCDDTVENLSIDGRMINLANLKEQINRKKSLIDEAITLEIRMIVREEINNRIEDEYINSLVQSIKNWKIK